MDYAKSENNVQKKVETSTLSKTAAITNSSGDIKAITTKVAAILEGNGRVEESVGQISKDRKDVDVTMFGYKTKAIGHEFTIEMVDKNKALCLGEIALQEREVQQIIQLFNQQGLSVTAIHNHWLTDKPKLIYVHIQSVTNPINFATKTSNVLKTLEKS